MLARIFVKDFALIKEVAIEFGPGLNVITGETGAGKSILLGALESLLGGPASAELVRSGADRCLVEGLFDLPQAGPARQRLEELDLSLEEDQLVLRRELHAGGRSRCFANGAALSLRQLRQLGAVLVDLHGQHEHQSLLEVEQHAFFLDAYGGLLPQVRQVAGLHRALAEQEQTRQRLEQEREALRRAEELRDFQLQEIRRADLTPGQEERLARELEVLAHLETLEEGAASLCETLYQAEGSLVEQLGRARRQLAKLAEIDPSLEPRAAALESVVYGVEDLAGGLRDYLQKLEAQPERLEQVREQLEELRRLKKKYGGTLEKVAELARRLEQEESRRAQVEQELGRLQTELVQSRQQFGQACLRLSDGRVQAARALAGAVEQGLKELGMEQARFAAELVAQPDPQGLVERQGQRWRADEGGLERAEFYLSANPGEPPRPLARIASGGEISRIMLVLKEIIAEQDRVSTLVFDEIDTGISGRIAAAVGRKLRALATSHQVIAITHLPQIASLAHTHFSVRKRQHQKRTVTEVHRLDAAGRAEEIARLLAGETVSEAARQHAQEMLH